MLYLLNKIKEKRDLKMETNLNRDELSKKMEEVQELNSKFRRFYSKKYDLSSYNVDADAYYFYAMHCEYLEDKFANLIAITEGVILPEGMKEELLTNKDYTFDSLTTMLEDLSITFENLVEKDNLSECFA